MLDFGLMPNRLFPAQLPCYEGQPGELKADPYIFVGSAGERPGRTARANGAGERAHRRRGFSGPGRRQVEGDQSRFEDPGSLATSTFLARLSSLRSRDITFSVRMIPGGPGCGLQIRRRCEVAEAQLLLSDVAPASDWLRDRLGDRSTDTADSIAGIIHYVRSLARSLTSGS